MQYGRFAGELSPGQLTLYFDLDDRDCRTPNTDKTSALDGPLFLVLEDLSAGVSLVNSSDATSCFATVGSPFIVVLPKGSALAPNTTAVIRLSLSSHGATP